MNENLNLVEILKDCPKGTRFYSTIFGYVTFICVDESNLEYPVHFEQGNVTERGHHYSGFKDAECTVFPDKDQRDWSKWKCPKPDLPIDTPMMVSENKVRWLLRYYAGDGKVWRDGCKSNGGVKVPWPIIIPFDKFNPNDIEGSLKYNIVGNGE